jgi:hypothetical protein
MPALKNQRHEKFVLALFEGKTATAAYAEAGFKPSRQNAARLTTNDDIRARLAELQNGVAKSSAVTLETILADLVDAAAVAKDRGQGQALVSAAMAKAKLLGLDIQRIEVGAPGDFDGLTSTKEIVDRELELLIERFIPVDEADKQGLIELHERHMKEAAEYIAAIKARPIIANRVNARDLSAPWQSHQPFTPTSPQQRIGYRNGDKPA